MIRLFPSQNEVNNVDTVTEERYQNILQEFFWHQLGNMDLEKLWFQENGATYRWQFNYRIDLQRHH